MSMLRKAAGPVSVVSSLPIAAVLAASALGLAACGGDYVAPAYALGGTVSGLSANGLVLADGTMTANVAAGATTFRFANGLAAGASYTVTVQTQPTGQTCSVANGSATMASADVTSVQVTCAANAYTVGGSISGLGAAGLVLANGSDTVAPSSGATSFTLAQAVASGASYSVTVQQQPIGETCSVAGTFPQTMGAGNVSGIAVTCAAGAALATSFVGNDASCSAADGSGTSAGFASTLGNGVFDAAGNLYVADSRSETIRKVTSQGVVSTLAGQAGVAGFSDGTGAAAAFNLPLGLAIDGSGNLYVADAGNGAIRMISPAGAVTTLAGSPAHKTGVPGDGPGASATFFGPQAVAVDAAGFVYFTENGYWIRRVAPNATHDVSLYAGNYTGTGAADGDRSVATFGAAVGLTFDRAGNLYVADHANDNVRVISPAGQVTTLAGPASSGVSGFVDATGGAARFYDDQWLAVDSAGNVFVSDNGNIAIREVTPAGVVTTVLHGAPFSLLGSRPNGIEVDAAGNIYVQANCSIVKITP